MVYRERIAIVNSIYGGDRHDTGIGIAAGRGWTVTCPTFSERSTVVRRSKGIPVLVRAKCSIRVPVRGKTIYEEQPRTTTKKEPKFTNIHTFNENHGSHKYKRLFFLILFYFLSRRIEWVRLDKN